jgi:2-polyprenyl-6-methoxyphenol hydroxylase-like FAD-dependent oxidoreductase
MDPIRTTCCIAGGGPAGMMLGFLLARAGVSVVVLEKHADFLRDFRGDTIHPSTLEVIFELGLLDEFLKLPHQKARHLSGMIGDTPIRIADFTHVPTRCKFIALMPQWDFLNFLAEHGKLYAGFNLRMRAEVTDLIEDKAPMVATRSCASGRDSWSMTSARRSTCSGCDCRGARVMATSRWAASRPGGYS